MWNITTDRDGCTDGNVIANHLRNTMSEKKREDQAVETWQQVAGLANQVLPENALYAVYDACIPVDEEDEDE